MFLSTLPGYAPKGHGTVEAVLTLEQLEEKIQGLAGNAISDAKAFGDRHDSKGTLGVISIFAAHARLYRAAGPPVDDHC